LLQALTVCFPNGVSDESPIAEATAKHLGLPHRRIPLELEDVNSLLCSVARAFDEPQGYSALLTMYLISKAAARDFKVVLAGDGGDEVFGGYTWYANINEKPKLAAPLTRRVFRSFVSSNATPLMRQRAARAFENVSPLHRHAWRLFPRFLPEEAEALLKPMGLRFGDEQMLAPLRKHFIPSLPLKRALQRVDLMTFCSDSILAKVDRASMAHSLEVRVPFLDRRVVERFIAAPTNPREDSESKPILRDYLRPRAPSAVLSAPKQGFSLRILDRFDWNAAVDAIQNGPWLRAGYWDNNWKALVQPGVPYREARIWTLLMLTRWGEAWLS
jgi:asparagine synthase (glutamine-hydrolysing)